MPHSHPPHASSRPTASSHSPGQGAEHGHEAPAEAVAEPGVGVPAAAPRPRSAPRPAAGPALT